jgi:gliding motility-associated-like protein
VVWTAATRRFQFYFNNVLKIDQTLDIVATVFGGDPNVFWGFTGTTGALSNEQRLCLTQVTVTPQRVCSVPSFEQPAEQCLKGNRFTLVNTTVEQGAVQYLWRFGDGVTSVDKHPIRSFAAAGVYAVTLVVSGGGCVDSVTRQVRVKPSPAATFQVDVVEQCLLSNRYTFTSTPQVPGLAVTYHWRFSDGRVSTLPNPVHVFQTMGEWEVRLRVTSSEGCSDSSDRVVKVIGMPIADFRVDDTLQCLNRNVFRFTDASLAFGSSLARSWQFGDGSAGAGLSVSRTYAAAGSFAVRLTVASPEGCRDSVTKVVRVLPVPVAAFDVDDADQCLRGNRFTFRNLTQANGTTVAYRWDFGDGASSAAVGPVHGYATAGVRAVKLRAGATNGCVDSVTRTLEVLAHPVAGFDVPAAQCLRGNLMRVASRSAMSGGVIADTRWSFGDGGSAVGLQADRSYAQPGTYAVRLTVTASNGCSDTLEQPVTVHPNPTVAPLAAAAPQCLTGNQFSWTVSSTIVSGTVVSHTWNMGDGVVRTGRSVTHAYASPGLYPVRVWAVSDRGCTDTAVAAGDVRPEPSAVLSADRPGEVCAGERILLRSGPELPGRQHQWLLDGNPLAGATDSFLLVSRAGQYRLRVVLGICQRTSGSFPVVVHPVPAVVPEVSAPQCLTGNRFQFTSRSTVVSGTLSEVWRFGDGGQGVGASVTHAYGAAGTFRAWLVATTDKGCVDSGMVTALVHAEPEVVVTPGPAPEICQGDSLQLVSASLAGSGTIRSLQWVWDGQPVSGAVSPSLTVRRAGRYRLDVENSHGCRKAGTDVVLTVNPLPGGILSQPVLPVICEGSALTLQATGADSYEWMFEGVLLPGATGGQVAVTYPGRYTVVGVSVKGCRNPIAGSVQAVLNRRPKPAFQASDRCVGLPLTFKNTSDTAGAGPLTWQWDFGDGAGSAVSSPTHVYLRPGPVSVTMRLLSVQCPTHHSTAVRTLTVDVPRRPLRYPAVNAVSNRDLPLEARGFGAVYAWTPSAGLSRSDTSKPVFRSDREQDYRIRIETVTGCVTVDSLLVRMFPSSEVYVPRAFSPNGDGHNDLLEVFLVGIREVKYFRVFNRWGQLVYETSGRLQYWDGQIRGVRQPADSYVWLADCVTEEGVRIVRRGQVVLIR